MSAVQSTIDRQGAGRVVSPSRESKDLMRALLQRAALDELRPITVGLTILFLVVTVFNYLILPTAFRMKVVYFSGGTAIFMFLITLAARKSPFIKRFTHLVDFIIGSAVYVNILILLMLSEQVYWASYIALLIAGMGFMLLSTGYLILLYTIIAYTWIAVATPHFFTADARNWAYFSVVEVIAIILGVIVHIVRVKMIERTELLRLETEHKNVELEKSLEKIRSQESTFLDLFENANDLIQMIDSEGNFIYVNRKWKEVLGYSDSEVKRLNLKDVVIPSEVKHCQGILKDLTQHPGTLNVETIFLTKDKREIIVEGNINSRFEQGKFISTRGIFRDVTQHRQNEIKMRRMTEQLESLSKKLSQAYQEVRNEKDKLLELLDKEDMIMLLDSKGVILGISEMALGATGYTRLEILGKSVVDILSPESRPEVVAILKNGFVGTYKSVKVQFLMTAVDFKTYTMGFHRINMEKGRQILVIIREVLAE